MKPQTNNHSLSEIPTDDHIFSVGGLPYTPQLQMVE
jgi:hypothetical protein